ncbi:uncharacterized protein K452DRAFT_242083 [Aplosporella prunicola CBS 121167]|uniref:Cytochrome P450 n=1 Tax=Aplosporella prunicola CBS 121167 TaxID=1176127 RepID=A0A6A6BUJ6_9PEZI|nr:uncharacterized protein K452DRAFT_242083 [Aplosporella prunicola CBS 121167]KAF2146894.1 hypothetical protein K452DRAFT_242083 [Aplosporella prunicola CBS 121167]
MAATSFGHHIPLIYAAVAGVTSHMGLFVHGEWERYAERLAMTALFGPPVLLAGLAFIQGLSMFWALIITIEMTTGFYVGLYGSMAIYRLFFHSLRSFPGPVRARLTSFWSMRESVQDFKWYLKVQKLHEEYGDFVRIRPREISIANVDAIHDIHSPTTKCVKGPFYDVAYPARSLAMTRDKKFHSQRRRVWDKAFSPKALKDYESRVIGHCNDLISQMTASDSKPVNATDLADYYGFDVMGDLVLGKSFDMLKTGEAPFILKQIRENKKTTGWAVCATWTFHLFKILRFAGKGRMTFVEWCKEQLQERRKKTPSKPDLYTHLNSADEARSKTVNAALMEGDLVQDAELAIIAGSGTTTSALAATLYLLAKHPAEQQALYAELCAQFAPADPLSHQALVGKPVLEGVINEALRLFPPIPSGVQRETPPAGAVIAGRWIPGRTIVSTPTWTLQRDPRNFTHPTAFLPSRWSTYPDLCPRKDAFNPFAAGTYSCVGRPLALMELRLAVASVVRKFDVRLADADESVRKAELEPGFLDCFTWKAPPVDVVFVERRVC